VVSLPLVLASLLVSINPVTSESRSTLIKPTAPAPQIVQKIDRIPKAELTGMPVAAKFLPDRVTGVIFLNTSSEAWSSLTQLFPARQNPFSLLEEFLPKDIQFRTDIQPWLTDRVAIAVFAAPNQKASKESSKETSKNPQVIAILPVKDRVKLDRFLAKLVKSQTPVEQDYKGIKILEVQAEVRPSGEIIKIAEMIDLDLKQRKIAIAALPEYLLVSSNAEVIKQQIDAQTNLKPLSNRLEFQRTVKHPQWDRSIVAAYSDYKILLEQFSEALVDRSGISSPSERKIFANSIDKEAKLYSTYEGFIWTQPDGIRSQSIAYLTTPSPIEPAIKSSQILAQLPADTYVSISSRSFREQWFYLLQTTKLYPTLKPIIDGVREFTPQLVGMDLERDILPWLDGEYAVILFPSNKGFFQSFDLNLSLALVVQTTNQAAANAALAKLSKFAKSVTGGSFKVTQRLVNKRSVTSWETPAPNKKTAPQSVFAYGWANRNTLIFTTGTGPMAALNPKPALSLSQAPIFKTAIQDLPQSNYGYFFMSGKGLIQLVYDKNPDLTKITPTNVRRMLNSIQGSVVVYSNTADRFQSDSFLGISRR